MLCFIYSAASFFELNDLNVVPTLGIESKPVIFIGVEKQTLGSGSPNVVSMRRTGA